MATFAELLVRIGGDATGFTTAMGTVSSQLDKTFTDAQKKIAGFDKLGVSLSGIGTTLTAGLTLPIAAVGIAATKMAADFELGMRKVTSLLGGATQGEFRALSDQTLELSRRLGVDAVNAADGLYMAISSGIPKENALTFLEIASKAAIAGLTDTRVAVDGMTTILQAFGLQTSETQKVADAMFQAVNLGKMEFPELAASIGLAAGSAKALGVSYQELLAAGATLTNTTGQKIPEAMTMLQSAMKAVIEPTADMQKLIKSLGYESGVALIKAKGLEGGLQAISAAAGGSIEVLAAAFGRVEGLRATLGITGDNAKRAASDLDGLKNSAGAATKAFDEIDKATGRGLTRLKVELQGIAIELGTALLPSVNSLLSTVKPMVGIMADAVRAFTALPQPIQQTTVGLVALAAALGPAIYLTGNLVTGFGALSKALLIIAPQIVAFGTALKTASAYAAGDFIGALTKGQTALLGFMKIAKLASIPIVVGTVVYLALDKLNEYGTKLDQTAEKIKELSKRQSENGALVASLTHSEGAHSAAVTKTASAYESLMGFMKNLKPPSPNPAAEAALALKRLKEEQERLNEVVATAKLRYDAVARAYNAGNASVDQLASALGNLTKAQRAADPEKWIEDQKKANESFQKWAATLEQKMLNAEGNITKARLEWLAFSAALVEDAPNEQLQRMADSASLLGGQMEHLSKIKWPDSIKSLSTQTEQAIEDEKLLGIEGEKTAEKLRAAYERLESEGLLNDRTRLQSKRNILAQEIKEAEAAGQKITEAQRKQLEEYEKILAGHGNKIRSFWRDLSKEIEGIARNWAVDIGRGLWDTLLGKGRREFNRGLDDQTADLQASLTERSAEWAAYQTDIAAQQQEARQKYEDTLAEERAALDESLSERTQEYADAEAETANKLEQVRVGARKDLDKTLADLAASLEERRGEYDAYVLDINEKLRETRREHANQLAAQLSDLQGSLDDHRRSYEEYVKDVNKRLGRIGVDYAESLDDETKQTKAGIEDKQQEYKRDEEDTIERIARLKRAGKTEQDEEVQDLRKSLRRKKEDLDEYIRERNEALAEYADDAKRQNERDVADLKESLAERTAEWTRYQAENAKKRSEAISKNATDLAKNEADLAKSLANRTADWVKYQADNAKKVEEAHTKYAEGLAKEESDLAESLAKKKKSLDDYVAATEKKWDAIQASALVALNKEESDLAASLAKRQSEYDAYVSDTQAKLDALVGMHRTAWDDIGGMMVNAFERAGESLMTFVTDYLMGELLDKLKKGELWDALTAFGKKIAGVFSGGGGVGSTIPSLPGAIPGASSTIAGAGSSSAGMAGAAGSSAAAWVGVAATAIGTAITAIGQAKMEGTLNAIEREARYAQIHLYYLLERANLYWPQLEDIHWYLWNRQDKWFESLDNYALRIDSYMDRIIRNLDERIAPAVEEARSWLQVISEILRDGFGSLPAAMVSAVSPIVAAVVGEPAGTPTEPAQRVATQVPGSLPTTRRGSEGPTRTGAKAIPLPVAAQYGSSDWLTGMLSRQEATLANVLKGYDPNNPLGKEDWAAAYAANTGPAYQEWLTGAITSTKGMLEQWATWAKAVADQARATAANAERAIVVNLEGGSARDQEFADMVINRYTRQLKAGGLL